MTRFPFPRFALPAVVLWTACLCGSAYGQLTLGWLQQFGGPYGASLTSLSATPDSIYVVGASFTGIIHTPHVTSIVGDIYLHKYYPDGTEAWARDLGPSSNYTTAVSAAPDGVYVAGGVYTATLTKYDPNGNLLWTRQFPGYVGCGVSNNRGVSGAADGVYVAGMNGLFSGSAFLSKYDPSGNELWFQQLNQTTAGCSVTAAADGAYIAGYLSNGTAAYIRKLDPNGNELWNNFIGSYQTEALDVATTADAVYVIGYPGFLRKYDTSGNEIWAAQIPFTPFSGVSASADNVFVVEGGQTISQYDPNGNLLATTQAQAYPYTIAAVGTRVYVGGQCLGNPPNPQGNTNACVEMLFLPGSTKPTSHVSALPAVEYSASFTVQWLGSDFGGPGIKNYTIYVSDNGGPFTAWVTTTATQSLFTGASGHTYGFYSIAQDSAGTLEVSKSAAEATTYVDATKPVSQVSSLPATEPSPSFLVQWSGTDSGGPGIQNYSIYFSDNGGSFNAWLTQTTGTRATFNGTYGHTYGFYSISQDVYGAVEGSKSAAEVITTVVPKPVSHV